MSKMNHINTGYWCPQCRGDVSHGEFIVSNILNQLSLKYSTQKTFSDLYSPYSSSKLICDFWISLFSLILEFDGKPHFKPCKFKKDITKEEMKKIFYEQLLRDREKDRWAKRKGKNLLRIDYKQMKSILDIIADTMVKIADNIRKNIKEPIIISPHAEWRENKIKELEKELNIIQE